MRDVLKLGLRLFVFTLVAALALAGTNAITSGPIAQQELAASQGAQRAVLPEAEIFEEQEIQAAPEYDQITALYAGKAGDAIVGYVMTAAPQGYGGPVPITLGIGADGSIHGISVGDLQETAGLGMKVGEEPFKSQFPGLAADPEEIDTKVQAISGASVTSKPFIAAVRQMVAYSKDVLGVEPNAAVPALEGEDLDRKGYVEAAEAFDALDVMSLIGDYGTIKSVYEGKVGDDAVGYVFDLSSKGFADQIGLRMGITSDGVISKVVMTVNKETEGYGSRTTDPDFCAQFDGKAATAEGYLDGVEALSGATVSSKAVFKAVGQAVDFYNNYLIPKEEPESAGDVYEVNGFGPMKIAIAVEDGKITSFEVVEHNETPGFGADVIEKGFDSLIGQEIATASFDAVSGATMTSNAINDALKQAAEKNGGAAGASDVYEVSGFQPMKIAIAVEDGKITSFEVVEHSETPGFGADIIEKGFESLIGQEIATASFDAVSGATMTSNAINDALKQAAEKNAAAPASEPEATEEPVATAGDVYEVSGFQPMKIAIAVEDGKITSFEVVEHSETPGFGADVIDKGFDSLIGQEIATASFDAVSGATMTSNAINDALKQAAEKNAAAPASEPEATEEPVATAGDVYEVSGFGPMKIAIAVEDGKITSFEVAEHSETPGFGADIIEKGFESLIGQEIATASFDAVSGATMTSNAINDALKQAAEKNGGAAPASAPEATATEEPAVATVGDVYEVSGFGPMKIAVAVEDGKITSFEVVEHSETPGFGADIIEKGFGSLIGQEIATASFDAVSGATMTSNAINDALKQAAEKNGGAAPASAPEATATEEPAAATVGDVYEVSGFGPMKIAIAVEDGKITLFEVVEHSETPGFGADVIDKGFESLIGQEIATASFDAVSGATMTSNAINDALKQAAEKNGGAAPASAPEATATEEPASATVGDVYEVSGFGPMKIAIAVEDGKITSFEVVEHSETPGFGADIIEKGFESLIGQEIATASFDAVSGATMTSNAINDALKQAVEKNGAVQTPAADDASVTLYTGTGKGFGGDVTLEVAADANDLIVSAAVVSHNETPGFGADVIEKGFDSLIGQSIGAASFDAVSGATMTSNAINDALKNLSKPQEMATPSESAGQAKIYEVRGFQPMKIAVAVEDGKIASFEVVEHNETPGFGADVIEKGFDSLIGQEIETASFDAVSGATMTSEGVNQALKLAAEEVQ